MEAGITFDVLGQIMIPCSLLHGEHRHGQFLILLLIHPLGSTFRAQPFQCGANLIELPDLFHGDLFDIGPRKRLLFYQATEFQFPQRLPDRSLRDPQFLSQPGLHNPISRLQFPGQNGLLDILTHFLMEQ